MTLRAVCPREIGLGEARHHTWKKFRSWFVQFRQALPKLRDLPDLPMSYDRIRLSCVCGHAGGTFPAFAWDWQTKAANPGFALEP